MSTPKERPILMSGPMVNAILEGRKTQTRRVVKMPNWLKRLGGDLAGAFPDKAFGVTPCLQVPCVHEDGDKSVQRLRNPWGWPEPSRLWVRETWSRWFNEYLYRATLPTSSLIDYDKVKPWRPSIFMPREASRITLEITNVRVERLNNISEDDAWAEGVTVEGFEYATQAFRNLWDKINGKKHPWSSNPWVWVVEFEKV